MCFFTSQSKKAADIARKYGRKTDIIEAVREILAEKEEEERKKAERNKKYNIYDYKITDQMYVSPAYAEPYTVIVGNSDQLQVMRWGLIPHTAKAEAKQLYNKKNLYKNARAENLFTKWPWKIIVEDRRCIIPVTGFFEPHYNSDGSNQPYYIERKDKQIFSIAALYDEWKDPVTKEIYKSFVMITVPATLKLSEVHNGGEHPFRMPLIIPEDKVEGWLNPDMTEEKEISEYLVTPDIDNELQVWPVKKNFNRTSDPFDPEIIEPF